MHESSCFIRGRAWLTKGQGRRAQCDVLTFMLVLFRRYSMHEDSNCAGGMEIDWVALPE